MKVRSKLREFGPCALLLPFLLILGDLVVVVVKIAAHFIVLRLHIMKVLLTGIEVMLPSATIVSTVARKENSLSTAIVITYNFCTIVAIWA